MEFEDWDSFMEPQFFFYGESSSSSSLAIADAEQPASSKATKASSSLVVDLATAILLSVAKVAVPAAALVWYQNLSESSAPCHFKGSCHCESVQFEFQAPRRLYIQTSRQQSRYNDVLHRFLKVQTSQFEIVKGEDYLKTFQLEDVSDLGSTSETISAISLGTAISTREDQGARAFCRRCGVHILHAPSQHSKYIKVNVTCVTNPAKSNNKVLHDSPIVVATKTLQSAKTVLSKTATMVNRKTKELIHETRGDSESLQQNQMVQSLRGLGDFILETIRPYASTLGSRKGSQSTDLTGNTTQPSMPRNNSNVSNDLSSVSNFSSSKPQSRLQLFHSAHTPKQANSSVFGSPTHHTAPPSLPQQ